MTNRHNLLAQPAFEAFFSIFQKLEALRDDSAFVGVLSGGDLAVYELSHVSGQGYDELSAGWHSSLRIACCGYGISARYLRKKYRTGFQPWSIRGSRTWGWYGARLRRSGREKPDGDADSEGPHNDHAFRLRED